MNEGLEAALMKGLLLTKMKRYLNSAGNATNAIIYRKAQMKIGVRYSLYAKTKAAWVSRY